MKNKLKIFILELVRGDDMMEIIKLGSNNTSLIEKGSIIVISYFFADCINELLQELIRVDSFFVTNFIGITSIFSFLALYFYIKGIYYKNRK